ncbi:hypothetical protein [Candidatus Venteria ishoeyi]|uniref:Uncharacterized protein n=1 Tax=Candidatus Venteria ishoeyi TaxID=1899563 RepID=A0A1H6F3T4_9GAMM|nr:hypothetical protein [Candidatus Venteria ishoeyi]SEH04742.1 Uncharacterised protein [Candidatus Venteria ishoeyi]
MGVPEKEYFSLTEIMKHWERSKIDEVTLLDYARKDILIYAVYLRDIGSHKYQRTEEDGVIRTTTRTTMKFVSSDYIYQPIRYLKADDARRILEAKEGEKIAVSVLYSSKERNKESGTGYLQAHYFEPKDLLVTIEERNRFEKEYGLRTGSKTEALWQWLSNDNNQKALKLIGGTFVTIGGAIVWYLNIS